MESLQFVGCSWFIGLIGLVSDSPEIKATENRLCAISRPSPVSSSTHLDAPGVYSVASKIVADLHVAAPLACAGRHSMLCANDVTGRAEQRPDHAHHPVVRLGCTWTRVSN